MNKEEDLIVCDGRNLDASNKEVWDANKDEVKNVLLKMKGVDKKIHVYVFHEHVYKDLYDWQRETNFYDMLINYEPHCSKARIREILENKNDERIRFIVGLPDDEEDDMEEIEKYIEVIKSTLMDMEEHEGMLSVKAVTIASVFDEDMYENLNEWHKEMKLKNSEILYDPSRGEEEPPFEIGIFITER